MNLIIIGGGVSGLTSAIVARRQGVNVTILEKNSKCGKKLLLTGNGRANFWNKSMDLSFYHTSSKKDLEKIITSEKDNVLDFIHSLGIVERINNGYYYPYTNQAISLWNSLLLGALNLGVKIEYESPVIKIEKEKNFKIYTKDKCYDADKIILATGGMSYPKTGSDGSGYNLLKKLGHTINKPLPSLVQLRGKENFYKDLKGVRSEVILTVFENKKKIKEEHGELIFTDYGISGICTFNISGIIARGLNKKYEEEIFINFIPWFKGNSMDFINFVDNQEKKLKDYTLGQILEGFLNYKIVNLILKLSNVKNDIKWSLAPKEKIVSLLMNFPFKVKETNTFNEAEVTTGGIPLEEINPDNMESKIVKDLYLVGEILDVDGICGGYNLGFAFMSSIKAGRSVLND